MNMLKIHRIFIAMLVVFGFSFLINPSQVLATNEPPLLALKNQKLKKYSNYQIYFYDPDASNCISLGGGGGSGASTLSGATRLEKIWNYIIDLGISGLSDSAEAIAGVLGNMSVETGGTYDPFIQNSFGCTGIIQWCKGSWNNGFFSYMKNKGFGDYLGKKNVDEDTINAGIQAELDFLFKDGSGGVTADKYIANLGVPGIQDGVSGARAYADLFLVTVENAFGGGDKLEDAGVASIAGHTYYQAAGSRRDRAETIFNMYGDWEGDGSDDDDSEGGEDNGKEYCEDGDESGSEDYEEPEAGNLVSYVKAWAWPNFEKNKTERMPAYADYIDNEASYKGDCGGDDCGAFVANIIKASGFDTSYPQAGTDTQKKWLPEHWEQVDANSLRLGDVGVKKTGHHVILYVGSISGFNSNTASASQCDRAPMAGADKNLNNYTWYRKK